MAAGPRTAWTGTITAGQRLRAGVAHDARAVAGTTSAATRRLRAEPQRLDRGDTITAPALPGAPGDVTTEILAVPPANGAGGDPDATLARGPGAERAARATWSDTALDVKTPSGGVAVLTPPDPTVETPSPAGAPSSSPAREAADDPSEGASHVTGPGSAAPGPGDVPRRRAGGRRREGVVVPLRVPWRTRLRATVGLMTLVAFLGALAAATVAAVLLGLLQLLSSV